MVIALLIDSATTEIFLNNFSEADFDLKHVSVIMKSVSDRNKIADDQGPFKNIDLTNLKSKLVTLKLTTDRIQKYLEGINRGKVLVAVDTYPDQDIISMLNDYQPEELQII